MCTYTCLPLSASRLKCGQLSYPGACVGCTGPVWCLRLLSVLSFFTSPVREGSLSSRIFSSPLVMTFVELSPSYLSLLERRLPVLVLPPDTRRACSAAPVESLPRSACRGHAGSQIDRPMREVALAFLLYVYSVVPS